MLESVISTACCLENKKMNPVDLPYFMLTVFYSRMYLKVSSQSPTTSREKKMKPALTKEIPVDHPYMSAACPNHLCSPQMLSVQSSKRQGSLAVGQGFWHTDLMEKLPVVHSSKPSSSSFLTSRRKSSHDRTRIRTCIWTVHIPSPFPSQPPSGP